MKLSVAGQNLAQPLILKKDPNSGGMDAALNQDLTALNKLLGDSNVKSAIKTNP